MILCSDTCFCVCLSIHTKNVSVPSLHPKIVPNLLILYMTELYTSCTQIQCTKWSGYVYVTGT